jgi:hypothetical protein
MKALITGASSGIGLEMAKYLAKKNIDLIIVSRNKKDLEKLKSTINVNVRIISMDLTNKENAFKLYELTKDEDIDILINNAGFGLFGEFFETDIDRELEMINLNVVAYHILTKLFLKDFLKKDRGYILNVCSSAGFMAGPKLSTYYATKNYITKLTLAISEELKMRKSNVSISALCPGPVNTNFNKVAGGSFSINSLSAEYVAKYAIDKMFKRIRLIVPGLTMKLGLFFNRFLPYRLQLKIVYKIQNAKIKGKKS